VPPHTNKDTLSAEVEETVSLLKKIKIKHSLLKYQPNKEEEKKNKSDFSQLFSRVLTVPPEQLDTSLASSEKLHYHYTRQNP